MKIALLNDSKQGLGGGFSFRRNLSKGLKALGHQIVEDVSSADIALISGATMVTRNTVREVKDKGVKLVTRIDNVPRNSRNRNTGTSRLKDYAIWADEVVYQCRWAQDYLSDFLERKGVIVYNSVDEEIFKPEGPSLSYGADGSSPIYLYSRFSRDETKRYEEAWYEYQLIHKKNPNAKLVLIGQFSPEHQQYNFDFFRGEKYQEPKVIDTPEEMARVYRGCDYLMAVYFCDCYSNTYLEALMSGVKLSNTNMSGGTPELIENFKKGREFNSLKRMAEDYVEVFERLLNGK